MNQIILISQSVLAPINFNLYFLSSLIPLIVTSDKKILLYCISYVIFANFRAINLPIFNLLSFYKLLQFPQPSL